MSKLLNLDYAYYTGTNPFSDVPAWAAPYVAACAANDKSVGITANGVETEVYLDRTNKIITIVPMHTWLANGSNDCAEAKETASMKIYLTDHKGVTKVVDVDDVPEVTGVAKDGWYLGRCPTRTPRCWKWPRSWSPPSSVIPP